jgi:hypothetical protein
VILIVRASDAFDQVLTDRLPNDRLLNDQELKHGSTSSKKQPPKKETSDSWQAQNGFCRREFLGVYLGP